MVPWPYVEASCRHVLPEVVCVVLQLVSQCMAAAEQVKHCDARSSNTGSQRVAEQIGPGLLAQQADNLCTTRGVATWSCGADTE